ncbi:DEAD/DEAH box helicase family protein [Moraxella osloensis]|nr:DEAD/DEAH box helicase family protein [Moraxella osloensis]MDK1670709.1 DEAD/DEAH box helicase family protein [Moraxella osloensis]
MAKRSTNKNETKNQTKAKSVKVNFHDQLILNQWLWSKFNPNNLRAMQALLDDTLYEGIETEGDNAGQTKFFTRLTQDLHSDKHAISDDDLRRYDLNIVKHWQQVTDKRNEIEGFELNLKYFQYLALLFTEYYLDQYYHNQQQMLTELNEKLAEYNSELTDSEKLQPYIADDLNKIAYWNATGSGKTLIMHVNILQYQHYHATVSEKIDQIILLTPNEGLSEQHLQEFKLAGINAMLFDKNKSRDAMFNYVQIIDINKLAERDGDKTVAAQSLEGNNLVLIDEGHRGTSSGGVWMTYRDTLTKNGFSFEYSATFGQAVSKAKNVSKQQEDMLKAKAKLNYGTTAISKLTDSQLASLQLDDLELQKARREALKEVYAKGIIFDYSYPHFYKDQFGKEVSILNMKKERDEEEENLYLTACLLTFYQQQYLYRKHTKRLEPFMVENPLWVFVGNKVNDESSDILTIIKFLANFLDQQHYGRNIDWINDLITNKDLLLDAKGNNIFHNRFTPLLGHDAKQVYQDILQTFFNAPSNHRLNVIRITQNTGELRLQVGENTPFGVINVGDEKNLFDTATEFSQDYYLNTRTDEFSPSLFDTLNNVDSKTNLLIGSRKFTEGWSSWRVSTMGLLNMGSGEGSQIIQLFGRGVRLKGESFSLKRTDRNTYSNAQNKDLRLDLLQTLNIFGLHADYMEQFRQYLTDEGIEFEQDLLTLDFTTERTPTASKLKTLVLKDGYKDNQPNGFKQKIKLSLFKIPTEYQGKIKRIQVVLDLYPRLQAYNTDKKLDTTISEDHRQTHEISPDIMAFFDFDAIYLQLQQYKFQRSYPNLQLSVKDLKAFCLQKIDNTTEAGQAKDWYTLYADVSKLGTGMQGVQTQQAILLELLQAYMDRFYKTIKNAYERQYYEVKEFDVNDADFPIEFCDKYTFTAKTVDDNDAFAAHKERLEALQSLVNEGKVEAMANWQSADQGFRAIIFDKHLYYPLFSKNTDKLPFTWSPMMFDYDNKGRSSEVMFVDDLQQYINSPKQLPQLNDYHIYLMRNPSSKNKGLGFALAGNFYPDFLLWLVHKQTGKQYLTVIDPKGLRNMSVDDAKINLYKEIKTIEAQAGGDLVLNSFILSITPFGEMVDKSLSEDKLKERNVLFMLDNKQYLDDMFERILA